MYLFIGRGKGELKTKSFSNVLLHLHQPSILLYTKFYFDFFFVAHCAHKQANWLKANMIAEWIKI